MYSAIESSAMPYKNTQHARRSRGEVIHLATLRGHVTLQAGGNHVTHPCTWHVSFWTNICQGNVDILLSIQPEPDSEAGGKKNFNRFTCTNICINLRHGFLTNISSPGQFVPKWNTWPFFK